MNSTLVPATKPCSQAVARRDETDGRRDQQGATLSFVLGAPTAVAVAAAAVVGETCPTLQAAGRVRVTTCWTTTIGISEHRISRLNSCVGGREPEPARAVRVSCRVVEKDMRVGQHRGERYVPMYAQKVLEMGALSIP